MLYNYFKRCYYNKDMKQECKMEAQGSRHIIEVDGFKLITYYDRVFKTLTEEKTGKLCSSQNLTLAAAVAQVKQNFNIIKNIVIANNYKPVADLPSMEDYALRYEILAATKGKPIADYEFKTYYVDYDILTHELYAGGATNSGIMQDVTIPYDNDIDIDANLQKLYEAITEAEEAQVCN